MIQSPENKVIVTVKSKYSKDFGSITKLSAIENAASVHLEDLVTIVGTVVSLPKSISKQGHYKDYGLDEIMVGDQLIFSFSVIYDFYQNEPDGPLLYRNKISYKAKDYWMADITKIYGIIRGEDIIMINGYVMAKPFPEDVIFTQPAYKKMRKCKSSEVIYIGSPRLGAKKIDVQAGDLIYYNPRKTQKYQINNKPFIILNQHQVLGKGKAKK